MAQSKPILLIICSVLLAISFVGTVSVFVVENSVKQDVNQYKDLLEEVVVLNEAVPDPANSGKYVIFSAVPEKEYENAQSVLKNNNIVWHKKITERYDCHSSTSTYKDSHGRSRTRSKERCGWETVSKNETHGKISLGQFENITVADVELSQLGKIEYSNPSNYKIQKGSTRNREENLVLDEKSIVTVLGKQTGVSIIKSKVNETYFGMVVRKGELSKDEMLKAAYEEAERAVSWVWTSVMIFITMILLGLTGFVYYRRKNIGTKK